MRIYTYSYLNYKGWNTIHIFINKNCIKLSFIVNIYIWLAKNDLFFFFFFVFLLHVVSVELILNVLIQAKRSKFTQKVKLQTLEILLTLNGPDLQSMQKWILGKFS